MGVKDINSLIIFSFIGEALHGLPMFFSVCTDVINSCATVLL